MLSHRPGILPYLEDRLGVTDRILYPVPRIEDIPVPESRLSSGQVQALGRALESGPVRIETADRTRFCCGRSYLDLMRLRLKSGLRFPDAVVRPATRDQLARILDAARENGIALVPYGGGTTVVGGVEPLTGAHDAVVTLDLAGLDRVLELDGESQSASIEPGIMGPALEARLAQDGFTLGHFPQSFEFSTVGGWVATRSAGQNSAGYGRIDEMVEGLEVLTAGGQVLVRGGPPGATGPSLKEILVGSEGSLGVISRMDFRILRTPQSTWTHAFLIRSWQEGVELIRRLVQEGLLPTIIRLSDPTETAVTAKAAPAANDLWSKFVSRAGKWLVKKKIGDSGCLLLVAFEGSERKVELGSKLLKKILRGSGLFHLGSRPGHSWRRDRFALPYLRDELLDRGALVETFETATTWDKLQALRDGVYAEAMSAFEDAGTRGFIFCHISHVYHTGASLYFTILARMIQGEELALWERVKTRVTQKLLDLGGRLSHHHSVGCDHRPFMVQEWGMGGARVLRALKRELDPEGILNPGKLIPDDPDAPEKGF